LETVAHVGENLLSRLRDGEITLTPEITTVLLQMVDAIRQMLQSIDLSGSKGESNDEELVQTLTRLQNGAAKPAAESKEASGVPVAGLEERQPAPAEGESTQAEAAESMSETQTLGSSESRQDGAELKELTAKFKF
jgi:two-component system, chemotaxis family, sensor kinase CheA